MPTANAEEARSSREGGIGKVSGCGASLGLPLAACTAMADVVMACIVMISIVVACIVMACIVMAYIVMAWKAMAGFPDCSIALRRPVGSHALRYLICHKRSGHFFFFRYRGACRRQTPRTRAHPRAPEKKRLTPRPFRRHPPIPMQPSALRPRRAPKKKKLLKK